MPECEVCGRRIDKANRVSIDGIVLETCNNCSTLGKVLRRKKKNVKIRRHVPLPKIKVEEAKPKEINPDFSKILREKREQMKMMQKDVAIKLNLPLSLIKRAESGFRPEDSVLDRLEKFYGISLFEEEN
ncbi:MAG: TIGR00270 family protein [Candidatus Aenigmarchaeota archaeon]|nr:TIGR00270 family protein [Candidatus Aenigmarchaeota archaeon]